MDGCNELLNRTRPDVIAEIHRAYYEAGCDLVETNTFGANLAALAEYGIEDQIDDLAFRGAKLARKLPTSSRQKIGQGSYLAASAPAPNCRR